MKLSRKGREAVKFEPEPFARGYYVDCDPTYGMSNSSYILGPHPWKLTQGK